MDINAFILQDDIACIRIKGNPPPDIERTPVHFCIILDNSGSMDSKLIHVKKSLHYMLNILTDDDYVSIITFSDDAICVVPRISITHDHKIVVQQRIKSIVAEGGTNLSAGLIAASNCLMTDSGHKQGILLLTDGLANQGIIDTSALLNITGSILRDFPGTTISCVGYGVDHNSDLLREISSDGGGTYSVVDDLDSVATVFGDILGGLVSCAFQQVCVQIPAGSTQITQLPGKGRTIRIGDLQSQGSATILIKGCVAGAEISIIGYDIHDLRFVNEVIHISSDVTDELIHHGLITYLRINVATLMERVSKAVAGNMSTEACAPLLNNINTMQNTIQSHITIYGHNPILSLLIEELEICASTINMPMRSTYENYHATQIITQHMTVVGLGRGIRNTSTPGRPHEEHSQHANVFSNIHQRSISHGIRSQVADEDPNLIVSGQRFPWNSPAFNTSLPPPMFEGDLMRQGAYTDSPEWYMLDRGDTPSVVSPVGSQDM